MLSVRSIFYPLFFSHHSFCKIFKIECIVFLVRINGIEKARRYFTLLQILRNAWRTSVIMIHRMHRTFLVRTRAERF